MRVSTPRKSLLTAENQKSKVPVRWAVRREGLGWGAGPRSSPGRRAWTQDSETAAERPGGGGSLQGGSSSLGQRALLRPPLGTTPRGPMPGDFANCLQRQPGPSTSLSCMAFLPFQGRYRYPRGKPNDFWLAPLISGTCPVWSNHGSDSGTSPMTQWAPL